METTWQEKVQVGREHRDASLKKTEPSVSGLPDPLPVSSQALPAQFLTAREFELTQKYDAIELLELLQTKKLTSEELTRAFLRRAVVAQYAVNCVTEILWEDAIERARYLDSLPEPVGPLHGLPISIKEHHGMILGPGGKNLPTNASYAAWVGQKSLPNALNDMLWNAGCVFYVRTTGPQTLMHLECSSNVYGRTDNPHNRNLTPGGSSGGEGALIGMRGSVLGVGGDIGGSVRCPASNNGIYGFKPTSKRLPFNGTTGTMLGKETVVPTFGPLCVSRETINLFMKVTLDTEPWRVDPSLLPKLWTPHTFTRPLKVAIEWDDGVVKPHPPTIRALREVADACRAAGMEVVDWIPYQHDRAWEIISALYFPDGGEAAIRPILEAGEPIAGLTDFITREQPKVRSLTMHQLWELCHQRDIYREEYARHWNTTGTDGAQEVDVIVCPTTPGCAPPHGCARYWGYTAQWNLLDYPGAVFPITFVDPAKDIREADYTPRNKHDRFNYDLYSGPGRYDGAPVSLQLVGRRNCDEKVMAALKEIELAMGRT